MGSESDGQLVSLASFKASGECPVEPYHLLAKEGEEMQRFGAAVRFGVKWLIDPGRVHQYQRERRKDCAAAGE